MALIPPVTRLTKSIIRILGCNPSPMTLQGTNTYLLGNGTRRFLIDTGDLDVPDYIKHLQEVLKQEKAVIDTIILTHWHHDHVGGVKSVVESCTEQGKCNVYKFPRLDTDDICPEIPSFIKVQPLHHEQEFSIDESKLKVIHTPGHSTDHVVLTTSDGILFSGDCVLGDSSAVFEDLFDYMKSLNYIMKLKPSVIYPAHGNVIKDPCEKVQQYINHRIQREQQIYDQFTKNPNQQFQAMDLVKIIYKQTPENLWLAAASNVNHHLQKMVKEGKIVATGNDAYMYKQLQQPHL